mmetsp:Transcript_59163/g.139445  ORF Transcript_59163/g.139445 Transcript_59163/m.139445 type:complete len:253 (+) Transcript_59163:439-1197(+)
MRARHARIGDAVGGLHAAAKHDRHVEDVEDAVQVTPDQPHAIGLGRAHRLAELGCGRVGRGERRGIHAVDMDRLDAATHRDAVEAAKAPLGGVVQAAQHFGSDEDFSIAGMVDQTRRHIDSVAETVAIELDHLTARECHLQPQRQHCRVVEAPRTLHGALQHVLHALGGAHAVSRRLESGHQAIAQRLDQVAAALQHGLADLADRLRDQAACLGIAQGLVEARAATQVGEEDGALADRGHGLKFRAQKMKAG